MPAAFACVCVLSFEYCQDAVEKLDQPAEEAAVDLAAVFAVLPACHHFFAGIAEAVVVGVLVIARGGDAFGVGVSAERTGVSHHARLGAGGLGGNGSLIINDSSFFYSII